ncbi:MAG TPA: M20/M25/M40 family metallo-hydrolase [Candidatus Bathyarchaeia archaeon]|nr:M20/M25/M40 family metallo-hydrolase [Candidatus Bathyarchaeia archaeon]
MNAVEILKQLIEFPTYQVTLDKVEKGMQDCAHFLSAQLEALGFQVTLDDLFNVTAERTFNGDKVFLLNTHFDTVPPSIEWGDALVPKRKGTRLIGLGASDAKGGIAATLAALSCLDSSRFAKLIVQFVNYEDNGIQLGGKRLLGMPYFLSNNRGFTADYGVNIEPTVRNDKWTVSLGCTGRVSFTVTTIGKEAHSSTPHQGKNAIYDMVNVIAALRQIPLGKFKMGDFVGEMPVNVALIEGGRAINIVPSECRITCERRILPNEDPQAIIQTIRSALENLQDVKVKCEFSSNVQLPYLVDKEEDVVKLAVKSCERVVGYQPQLRIGLGRTDSMYLYHMAGIKTVIMGPGHVGHVIGENISIDRLDEFAVMLGHLLKREA